jgi:hypothetical protein
MLIGFEKCVYLALGKRFEISHAAPSNFPVF